MPNSAPGAWNPDWAQERIDDLERQLAEAQARIVALAEALRAAKNANVVLASDSEHAWRREGYSVVLQKIDAALALLEPHA